jgi:hypothetical protein
MELVDLMSRVTVKIGGREYTFDIAKELAIDINDLNRELSEQPGKYAFWSALSTALEDEYARLKLIVQSKKAERYKQIKQKLLDENKKVTEAQLENELASDPEILQLEQLIIEKERDKNIVRAIRDAFVQRKDSLVTIALNMRVEKDAELRFVLGNKEK